MSELYSSLLNQEEGTERDRDYLEAPETKNSSKKRYLLPSLIATLMIVLACAAITVVVIFLVTRNSSSQSVSESTTGREGIEQQGPSGPGGWPGDHPGGPGDESTEKDVAVADLFEQATAVSSTTIALGDYSTNIKITAAGTYTITGTFTHSILISTIDAITLNLNGVTITAADTAAIAQLGNGTMTINVTGTNALTDPKDGSTDADACIYSVGELVITGTGTLNVTGQQTEGEGIATEGQDLTITGSVTVNVASADDGLNAGGSGGQITISGGYVYVKASGDGIDSDLSDSSRMSAQFTGGYVYVIGSSTSADAGIDTDGGFIITGGTLVALGSSMLETPQTSGTTQNTLVFSLDSSLSSGTTVALLDSNGGVIVAFEAGDSFSTLIISTPALVAGTYTLSTGGTITGTPINHLYGSDSTYSGGSTLSVNGSSSFTVSSSSTVFSYGKSSGGWSGH